MAESSVGGPDAPRVLPGRPIGRLGLVAVLVAPALVLASITQVQSSSRGSPPVTAAAPAEGPPAIRLAFGSVTAGGAILFRLGAPVHATVVDADGRVRWERDLADGDHLACGPCPAVVGHGPDGAALAFAADGRAVPPSPDLGPTLLPTTSLDGIVLAAPRPDGRVHFLVPTSDGRTDAGSATDPRVDQRLVVVTPSADGRSVTVLRAPADPLLQAELEVLHVDPSGETLEHVALDTPRSRPLPCVAAGPDVVALLQQGPGPTADGTTHVVVRRGRQVLVDQLVAGWFDRCATGPAGTVLASAATGADGDLGHTQVRLVWLGLDGAVRTEVTEPVDGPSASVALDPRAGLVALAGGAGAAVVTDGRTRVERPPAAAVAFDDRGGVWWADAEARVRREEAR